MKKPKPVMSAVCAALLVALHLTTGCQTGPEIKYEADKNADLRSFKTYALIPFDKSGGVSGGANPGSGLKYASTITTAIKNALATKGFTETGMQNADFAVHVRAEVVPQVDVTDWGYNYAGYGRWGGGMWAAPGYGYNVSVDSYKQGTLRVEIYDTRKKDMVWVGWASDRVDDKMEPGALAKVITDVLSNFPVPAAPAK